MLYKYNKIFIQKSHNTYLDRDYCKFILVHGLHHEVKALNHLRINHALVLIKDKILVPANQLMTAHLIFANAKDKSGVVVDHRSVLQLPLSSLAVNW